MILLDYIFILNFQPFTEITFSALLNTSTSNLRFDFPSILGLRNLSYIFRFSGINANMLAEIQSKLKE
jgi:hypothetical protein